MSTSHQKFLIRRQGVHISQKRSWAAFHFKSGPFDPRFQFVDLDQFMEHIPANSFVDTVELHPSDFKLFYQAAAGKGLQYRDRVRAESDNGLWPGPLTELISFTVDMETMSMRDIVKVAENVSLLDFILRLQPGDILYLLYSLKKARSSRSGELFLLFRSEIHTDEHFLEYFFQKVYQELQGDFPFAELHLLKPEGISTRQMKTFAKGKIQSTLRLVWLGYEAATVAFCQGDNGGVIVLAEDLGKYRAWEHIYTLRLHLCQNSGSTFHRLPGELRRSLQEFLW